MLSLWCRGLTRLISWSLQKFLKWQWPTLSIYFIKLQQPHWSFLPRKVFWAPVQEHRKQIPVTRSAQFSLPGDSSGKPWAKDLYQHISSETTIPVPHFSCPAAWQLQQHPARQGAGRGGCFLTATSQVGSVQRNMREAQSTRLVRLSPTASAVPAAPVLHTGTHMLLSSRNHAAYFLVFFRAKNSLKQLPFPSVLWPHPVTVGSHSAGKQGYVHVLQCFSQNWSKRRESVSSLCCASLLPAATWHLWWIYLEAQAYFVVF